MDDPKDEDSAKKVKKGLELLQESFDLWRKFNEQRKAAASASESSDAAQLQSESSNLITQPQSESNSPESFSSYYSYDIFNHDEFIEELSKRLDSLEVGDFSGSTTTEEDAEANNQENDDTTEEYAEASIQENVDDDTTEEDAEANNQENDDDGSEVEHRKS